MSKPLFTNQPYTEGRKSKPIHLTRENIGHFIYPDEGLDYSDYNQMYISTENMTVCTMDIGPGGFFDPPDYHPGDEMYYVLKGAITQYNPELGQVIRVKAGESLLIPKGGAHVAYNFEEESLRIMAVIAPKIVEDQLFPTDGEAMKRKTFMGKDNKSMPPNPVLMDNGRIPTIEDAGSWPLPGETLRKNGYLYHVTENKKLLAIHGHKHPTLIKLSISNDFMQVGEMIVPFGGSVCRYTESFQNHGETFLYAPEDKVTVYLPKEHDTIVLWPEEGLYLPPSEEFQIVNYGDKNMKVFFAMEPGK
ncbi:MAG: cupin domain-containing protein [Blautia sp.]|jgi:mannose-6-phosphate isomerase-like protein (cupin superfamily)